MKQETINKKLNYYCKWYQSMTYDERSSIVGDWVYTNVLIYLSILGSLQETIEKCKLSIV